MDTVLHGGSVRGMQELWDELDAWRNSRDLQGETQEAAGDWAVTPIEQVLWWCVPNVVILQVDLVRGTHIGNREVKKLGAAFDLRESGVPREPGALRGYFDQKWAGILRSIEQHALGEGS